MTDGTSRLWTLIQAWLDTQQYPPSQGAIARAVGVSTSAVSDWKYGRSLPRPEHLKALAAAVGCTYDELLDAALADNGYLPAAEPPRKAKARRTP